MGAATSTLNDIMIKVRRLTRSPSPQQLSDTDIQQYINTAILYDFPQHLRLSTLQTTVTWYTQAYIDTYYVNKSLNVNDPLYDFENRYITIDTPVYIAGQRVYYTQSRDVFFGAYPQNTLIENFASGDGVTTTFTGTFNNFPIQQGSVIFSAVDSNNITYTYRDAPVQGTVTSAPLINVNTGVASDPLDGINYIDGSFRITFGSAPADGANVVRQSLPYTPAMPTALLYYDLAQINSAGAVVNNKVFTVRPIPDGAYPVNIQAFRQPMQLLATNASPELNQWWQYIAYLAAKKVFDDRLDEESIQKIMPELKKQEALVLSKKVVQNTTQRAATIYSPQLDNNPYFGTQGWWQGPIG